MKKILLSVFITLTGFTFFPSIYAQSVTFDDGVSWNCDQYFTPRPLRYWKLYSFHDTWNNNTNKTTYLNSYEYQFQNASYLSRGAAFPDGSLFDWTANLRNAGYAVAPYSSMKVLSTRYEDWGIVKKPTTRSNPATGQYDFMIAYKIVYDKTNNYPDASDDIAHVECQPYYVTWCGDGVKDPAYEQCDGTDGLSAGQTCNNSCQIENNPTPACINLTSSVLIGDTPVSTNVSCTTQNATSVQIDCGNGQTINSSSGTCTYTTPGYYSAVCKVNGSITNANCQKNIQVNPIPVPPLCDPSRIGVQSSPMTQGYCISGTSYNFTSTGTNPINYSWTCNNASQSVNCSASYIPSNTGSGFDLSLKKYIGTDDAQPGSAVSLSNGSVLNYIIRVKNEGNGATAGVTTVRDILPVGVTASGAPSGTGWTCSYSGATLTCTSTQIVASGSTYPDIIVPVVRYPIVAVSTNPLSQYIPKDAKAVTVGSINIVTESPTRIDFIDIARTGLGNTGSIEKIQLSYSGQAFPATVTPITGGYRMTFTTPLLISGVVTLDLSVSMNAAANEQHQFSIVAIMISTSHITGMSSTIGVLNTTSAVVTPGSGYRTSPLPETASPVIVGTPVTSTIQNNAVVHNPNESLPCYADNRMPAGDESVCTTDPRNTDPAVIIIGATLTGFDLSLKKYIGTDDAQPGSAVSLSNGSVLNYIIRVKNEGPQTTTGITTVRDILPVGVSASGAASGTNWNCSYSGAVLACITGQVVSSGSYFSDIIIPVVVTATTGQTVTNYATVQNPSENNACYADNRMPNGDESSCTNDAKNNDPAQFVIPGGGGGGGAAFVGKSCINGIASCAYYNSIFACTAAGIPQALCYSADAKGIDFCKNQSLSCGGSGGPSGGSGPSGGTCGNGVLESGEECDVNGAPWCNAACKLDMTNPGANPITNLWIRIPALSHFTLGTTFLDRIKAQGGYQDMTTGEYRLPVNNHQIVVGQYSNIFSVADRVYFGINTKYTIPLAIPETYKVCIYKSTTGNEGDAVIQKFGSNESCKSIADMIPATDTRRTILPGYVLLGKGDVHKCVSMSSAGVCTYANIPVNTPSEIQLYTGNAPIDVSTTGLSLRDAFQGGTALTTGGIHITLARGDLAQGDRPIDMKIPVRVSAALLSTTATPVNRSIEQFVNLSTRNILASFLGDLASKTSLSATTTAPVTPSTTPSLPTANITLPTSTGDRTLNNPSGDFVRLNGNPNILYVKDGKGYINAPYTVSGVKTIIVENGDLVITSDITYADAQASIAFIVKNGNVVIDKDVSNLAGVFVVIPGSTVNSGQFVPLDGLVSQKILRVEGSLYGNAKPLFDSRLYARGTNAYEIITTGTVITYSNRALVNPPPLLSNYLGNYSVSRVVQ